MDWNAAIEKNRQALKRVLAMLVSMAGLSALTSPLAEEDGSARRGKAEPLAEPGEGCFSPAPTLPRHLHRAVLGLLRPAEAAARRLIIVAARGIVVALPPAPQRKPEPARSILRNGIGTGIVLPRGFRPGHSRAAPGSLALPLFDPLPRWRVRARPVASGFPRVSIPGLTRRFPVPRPPSPDDPIDAARLALRLGALGRALDNLPREARRFARWRARAAAAARMPDAAVAQHGYNRATGRLRRVWPLRPGRPPGGPRRPRHEVHEILSVVHGLAFWALESPDTS